MAEYDNAKWQRDLPFPLTDTEYPEYTENNSGTVVKPVPDFFNPDEPDEIVDIHFRMSMSQFTAIASAIDVGRDIAFGERSYELWRTWCKALIGEITVSCETIADCIETNEATQIAISVAIETNETIQNTVTETNISNGFSNTNNVNYYITTPRDRNLPNSLSENATELPECNLDVLWGAIRHGIVARLDDTARDMLEDLAAINDVAERLEAFIGIVPVVGSMVQAVAEQITETVPDILNLYNSYSSEATLDDIACELFAVVCSECRFPTFEEVFEQYRQYSGIPSSLNDLTLESVAQEVLEIVLSPAQTAYNLIQVWALWTLAVQSVWNGLSGTRTMLQLAELGEDFANDNWKTLCDSCNEPYSVMYYDFRKQDYGAYATLNTGFAVPLGTYVAGKGWRSDNIGSGLGAGNAAIWLGVPFQASYKIRGIAVKTSVIRTSFGAQIGIFPRPNPRSSSGQSSLATGTGTNSHVTCKDGLAGATNYQEIGIYFSISPKSVFYIEEMVVIIERADAPPTAQPTADQTACDWFPA